MVEHFFIYNNNFYRENTPVMGVGNRALMYGDGLFETMRIHHNIFVNKSLHFDRFFAGILLLKFPRPENFTVEFFVKKMQKLLLKNGIENNARVRLMAFRREETALNHFNGSFNYIMEAWPIEEVILINEVGMETGVFKDVQKSCDPFSNIKSNNYLASVMARIFAKENNLDECLLINSFGRICESAIANVFIIKQKVIYTPPLSEGCVAGVVRRWLLENLPTPEFQIIQKEITPEDVHNAEEIFLTNSLKPVRWVQRFQNKEFGNTMTERIAGYVFANMTGVKLSND